jgi:hypothetical protein
MFLTHVDDVCFADLKKSQYDLPESEQSVYWHVNSYVSVHMHTYSLGETPPLALEHRSVWLHVAWEDHDRRQGRTQ